jgi:hypothetical protein
MQTYRVFFVLIMMLICNSAQAFQIAPTGSSFEAELTREKDSNLYRVAGKVGVLLKAPVHEEITQLAGDCPANNGLINYERCAGANVGFVSPFIIYGVRWNDLPPFRLDDGEGNCQYLGINTCKPETVRFSTQPTCWYCLFQDAQKKAKKSKISRCEKGPNIIKGNLMTRSHFGDLQFLHAMAADEGELPQVTQQKILDWLEFAWKVSSGEIPPTTFLKSIPIASINIHFGCTDWRVSDIYILGRQGGKKNENLTPHIREIAFGSILHTVQDSFAAGHTFRETTAELSQCLGMENVQIPRIKEFHTYISQDGAKHDHGDSRDSMVVGSTEDLLPFAVQASKQLFKMRSDNNRLPWIQAKSYMQCLFELAPEPIPASAGLDFVAN